MKQMKKRISLVLAAVMTLSLVPASVLSAAAADAYQVLFEPQMNAPVGISFGTDMAAYGDTAAIYSVTEKVYQFVRFTGNNLEGIPGKYHGEEYPLYIGKDYISVPNASCMYGVIDKTGRTVVDFNFDWIYRPDDSGVAKAGQWNQNTYGYYLLNLNTKETSLVTEDTYERYGMNGYSFNWANDEWQVVDANGAVILSGAGKNYKISGSYKESIKDGLVAIYDPGTYQNGFVNLSGEVVIPTQYDRVGGFHNGYVLVYDEQNNAALLDKKGGVVIPFGAYKVLSDVSPDGLVWASNAEGTKVSILKVGSAPEVPVTPATAEAMPTNDTLKVNGEIKDATVYKIGDSNYFKIRDLAAVLNGTSKQFAVGYDAASSSVTATTGQPYELAGGELAGPAAANQTAAVSNDTILVNGSKAENVTVYKIDGSNYFKLRDLGAALGFDVGWSAEEGMFINTEG